MELKLNLGCGPDLKEGYVNIDTCPIDASKVVAMDVRDLAYEDGTVDEIYAKDIIEHMSLADTKRSIANWSRICKTGAKLFIQTVSWDSVIKAYYAQVWDMECVNYMLFAGKNWVDGISRPEDFHKSTYSVDFLASLLRENNFAINHIELDRIDELLLRSPLAHNLNMRFYATKK